jgi:hypothetical protein
MSFSCVFLFSNLQPACIHMLCVRGGISCLDLELIGRWLRYGIPSLVNDWGWSTDCGLSVDSMYCTRIGEKLNLSWCAFMLVPCAFAVNCTLGYLIEHYSCIHVPASNNSLVHCWRYTGILDVKSSGCLNV